MNKTKINTLIQFAIRSKSICFKQTLGFNVYKRRVFLIVVASDISQNSRDDIDSIKKNIPCITLYSKVELGELFSKAEVSGFGIMNVNIAKEINKLVKEEE
ncbi:MAG: hypothetical protein RR578_00240 [Bacilli bacterium]